MSCSRCFCDWMSVGVGVPVIRCLFWVFLWLDISCSGCYYDWISVVGVTVTGCLLFRVLHVSGISPGA